MQLAGRERGREQMCVRVCVCVCTRARERERERERENERGRTRETEIVKENTNGREIRSETEWKRFEARFEIISFGGSPSIRTWLLRKA